MKKRAFLYIIIAGLLWGTSGLFVHFLAPFGFSTLQMTAMRGMVSAVCMSVYTLLYNKQLFRVNFKELRLFACSGIAMFGTAACYYIAMQASSVSTAVILMYTAPVMVMAYSVAFMGERFTKKKYAAIVCMLIGCCLVSGVIGGLKFSILGIVMGLMSGVCYSAYNIFTKYQMCRQCHPITANLYCLITMCIVALLFANPGEMAGLTVQNPAAIVPLMLGIGICTCVLPYFLYTLALKVLPAGTTSALGIVEPMAATVYSVILLGEPLGISSVLGIILILGAVPLLSRSDT